MDFITELSTNELFKKLCPIDKHFAERREEEELILRFFAFSEAYPSFRMNSVDLDNSGVARFLDNYLQNQNEDFSPEEITKKKANFLAMLKFVDHVFKDRGFGKHKNSQATSRPYFEAIAIGSHFALNSGKQLNTNNLDWSILDKRNPNKFYNLLSGRYHTHKPSAIKERIDYVVSQLTS